MLKFAALFGLMTLPDGFPELIQICGRNERISSRSERKQASGKVCTMTVMNDHAESEVL